TETSTQTKLTHVLMDQGQTILHRSGKRSNFTPGCSEHRAGGVDASDFEPRRGERQGDASSSTGEFEEGSARLACQALIESNIAGKLRQGSAVERAVGFDEQRLGLCVVNRVHAFPPEARSAALSPSPTR